MPRFELKFIVPKTDIDQLGHVNNVAYVRWVQDAAVAHWLGATTEEQQAKFVWIMLRHEIDYKKQAFENEEITATTWVGIWTAVTCERFVEIKRGADSLAKSRTVWCLLDRETSKPTRISTQLKELFN